MLKMSFYDGTLDKAKAKTEILKSEKHCEYTYGLSYRNPTTYHKPVTKDEAIKLIDQASLLDITENDEVIHLNEYSENDMW